MPNCKPTVAARGWQLYRASAPPPSLADLNTMLGTPSAKMRLVPARTSTTGAWRPTDLRTTFPINEVDVRLKLRRAG